MKRTKGNMITFFLSAFVIHQRLKISVSAPRLRASLMTMPSPLMQKPMAAPYLPFPSAPACSFLQTLASSPRFLLLP